MKLTLAILVILIANLAASLYVLDFSMASITFAAIAGWYSTYRYERIENLVESKGQ